MQNRAHAVDAVLLDGEKLPWMEQYRRIKIIDQEIKVVLMSRAVTDAVKAYEAGTYNYLLKSVKYKQLERVVAKIGDG